MSILKTLLLMTLLLALPAGAAAKPVPTLELSDMTAVYSGREIIISNAQVKVPQGMPAPAGEIIYSYYADKALKEPLAHAPKDAGTYYVSAAIAADATYEKAQSSAAVLVITPAAPKLTLSDDTVPYTGYPTHINAAWAAGVSVSDMPDGEITYTYYVDSGLRFDVPAPISCGTYHVVAHIAAHGNYAAASSPVAKLTVADPQRPSVQTTAPDGTPITLLTDADTMLHLNWSPVYRLVQDAAQAPAVFSPLLESKEEGSLSLTLSLAPDSSIDGQLLMNTRGKPVYSQRTLTLTPDTLARFSALGIDTLSVTYSESTFSISLAVLYAQAIKEDTRILIEPFEAGFENQDGTLVLADPSGITLRIAALAKLNNDQESILKIPGLLTK